MEEIGHMLGISGAGPPIPWLWIIEYLSSFPQIDISIICELIEQAPVLPENLGENTSEMVALRCLEELFDTKSSLENVAPPDSRLVFDLSLSCEDVLGQILQEVPFSNLNKGGPELLRWDVHPFIRHKRASLPKCALEKLKDKNLELSPGHGNQEGNFIPQIHKNDAEALQDGSLNRNLLPSKRYGDDLVAENLVGQVSVNQDGMHNNLHLNAKKFKQDATPTCERIQFDEGIPIQLDGEEIKVTEIEGIDSGNDSRVGEGDQNEHVPPTTLEPSDASHLGLQDNQMGTVQNASADVMVEQKYQDSLGQNVVMDEPNYVENCTCQKGPSVDAGENILQGSPSSSTNSTSTNGVQKNTNPADAKADMNHPCAEEICKFEDERSSIALKKSLFLSLQRTQSQDPVQKAGWTEQKLCVNCNQNGQLLVCSSRGCPLVVHESCLDSAARFYDEANNFYCPFCACSISISKYLEAKDKSSLAKKELAAFMELLSTKPSGKQRNLQSGHQAGTQDNFMSTSRLNGRK